MQGFLFVTARYLGMTYCVPKGKKSRYREFDHIGTLSVDISGLQMMKNFSHKHRLHFLLMFEYNLASFPFLHLNLRTLQVLQL